MLTSHLTINEYFAPKIVVKLFLENHVEIVDLQNRNSEISQYLSTDDQKAYRDNPLMVNTHPINQMQTFTYRFIQFQYDYLNDMFSPIVFDYSLPYSTIHSKYSGGI